LRAPRGSLPDGPAPHTGSARVTGRRAPGWKHPAEFATRRGRCRPPAVKPGAARADTW